MDVAWRLRALAYWPVGLSACDFAEHDFRLQTIHHKNPSAATLSKFDYTYDTVGNILTWRQERAGSAAKIYAFTHDLVDQLTAAVLTDTNSTPTILKRQAWSHDEAGNRVTDQDDDAVFASAHDAMNRLQSRAPGGPIVFSGSLDEAATVTIDGKPAEVDASNNFRGTATLSGATTTVTLKAKDYSGNETTKQYEVDASGSTTSYTYDANGNLTSDGTKTYFWNAVNQLVEVKEGTTTIATFEYDGVGRRTEKVAAGLTHQYIYDAEDVVEERLSGSSSDTIRYYHGAGIDEPLARKNSSDVVTYYLADHLGSVVQETNASGSVTLNREYDAWGELTQGGSSSGFAFTGREWDAEIGLYYSRMRYYDPQRARFVSDDPIGLAGGTNLSRYVGNAPVDAVDPFGLQAMNCKPQVDLLRKVDEFFGRSRTDQQRKEEIMSSLIPPPAAVEVPSEVEANLARFLKALPKAFKTGGQLRVDTVADDFLFTADVPGNVPGSSAVYQKLVDAAGQTKEMIKTTLDAMGEVIHIKRKF